MNNPSFALLCNNKNGSPKVLAESLDAQFKKLNIHSKVYYQVKALKRLFSSKEVKHNRILWSLYRLRHLFYDRKLYKELQTYDAVIICDTTPNAFYRDTYNVQKFRKKVPGIPVIYYAVQFLLNAPTIVKKLKKGDHASLDRYDWHLTVSEVTELRGKPSPPWSQIGLFLKSSGLYPKPKERFVALVDFLRPGFEKYRETQIKALEEANIPFIELQGTYSMDEIRRLYQESSIMFIQFPEAYGVPIAECFACGTMIGTPDSSWAMSWRLDEELEVHGPGKLADCFMVYDGIEDLKTQLIEFRDNYNLNESPQKVFKDFTDNYESFYHGNEPALLDFVDMVKSDKIVTR